MNTMWPNLVITYKVLRVQMELRKTTFTSCRHLRLIWPIWPIWPISKGLVFFSRALWVTCNLRVLLFLPLDPDLLQSCRCSDFHFLRELKGQESSWHWKERLTKQCHFVCWWRSCDQKDLSFWIYFHCYWLLPLAASLSFWCTKIPGDTSFK